MVKKKRTKKETCKLIKSRIKKLENKWKKDIKSDHNAGGNSKDNQMLLILRIALKVCK